MSSCQTKDSPSLLSNFVSLLFACRQSCNNFTDLNLVKSMANLTQTIFYHYLLEKQDAMTAYHILKLSEFYLTRVLSKSFNIGEQKKIKNIKNESQENRNSDRDETEEKYRRH